MLNYWNGLQKNINDIRESPALHIFEKLEDEGVDCAFYDPYVTEIPNTRMHSRVTGIKSVSISQAELELSLIHI